MRTTDRSLWSSEARMPAKVTEVWRTALHKLSAIERKFFLANLCAFAPVMRLLLAAGSHPKRFWRCNRRLTTA